MSRLCFSTRRVNRNGTPPGSEANGFLYILLEYAENGSLAGVIKPNRFGPTPEPLAAVYAAQVLDGLAYLHDQGGGRCLHVELV